MPVEKKQRYELKKPEDIYTSNPIPDLEAAVKAGDAERLFQVIAKIDRTLTGAHSGTFAGFPDASLDTVKKNIENFLQKYAEDHTFNTLVVYLGDGGFSRLWLGDEKGKFTAYPTYNTPKDVKADWDKLVG